MVKTIHGSVIQVETMDVKFENLKGDLEFKPKGGPNAEETYSDLNEPDSEDIMRSYKKICEKQ